MQHSSNPVVVGAIPTSVDEESITDFDALLSRTQAGSSKAIPRFHPAFWAAFRKHLEEDKRRYMGIRAPLRFVDATPGERPENAIEVERERIVGPDATIAEVVQQAEAWLTENENEVERTLYLSEERSGTGRLPVDDLLGRLLLALDAEDLKRITLPLDIVSKLRRKAL